MSAAAVTLEAAHALMNDYAERIDSDRLEDWLDLFTEDCTYRIVPRENADLNLPAALVLCVGKNMLRDRVAALRGANKFNLHYDRHFITNIGVTPDGAGAARLAANYAIFQTTHEGVSRLFSVGRYEDRLAAAPQGWLIRDKHVIVDTFAVPSMLATPI